MDFVCPGNPRGRERSEGPMVLGPGLSRSLPFMQIVTSIYYIRKMFGDRI